MTPLLDTIVMGLKLALVDPPVRAYRAYAAWNDRVSTAMAKRTVQFLNRRDSR